MGIPKNGWFFWWKIVENPMKMDDEKRGSPISGNLHM